MSLFYVMDVSTRSGTVYIDNDKLMMCRICLARDVKMKSIAGTILEKCYKNITGLNLKKIDLLPQFVCWECAGRLKTANTLRDKAIKSHILLTKIASQNRVITIEDVNYIDREENKLKSSLVQTQCDFNIYEEVFDPGAIKEEFILEYGVEFEEHNHFEEFDKAHRSQCDSDDNKMKEISSDFPEDFDTKVECYDIKVKKETNDNELTEVIEIDDNDDYTYNVSVTNDKTLDDIKTFDSVEIAKNEEVLSEDVKVEELVVKIEPDTEAKTVDWDECIKKIKAMLKIKVAQARTMSKERMMLLNQCHMARLRKYQRAAKEKYKAELSKDFRISRVSFDEQIAEMEKRKESAIYLAKRYKCVVCYTGFSSKAHYEKHVARHGKKKGPVECFVCKRRFTTSANLLRHLALNHTNSYSCLNCEYVTTIGSSAKDHQKSHKGRTYECTMCCETFRFSTSYLSHLRIKHPSRCVCNLCGYTFLSAKGVKRHKLIKHDGSTEELNGPFCEKCDVRFASEDAYQRHLKLSSLHKLSADSEFTRNDCTRKDRYREAQANRALKISRPLPTDPISCELCGLVVVGFRGYISHFWAKHPGQRRAQFGRPVEVCMCEQCGKRFRCKALLVEHMNVHTRKESYKCESCERRFFDKAKLRMHRQVHKNIRYPCPHCAYQFTQQANCRRHILTVHKRSMEFRCEICGKTVTTAKTLQDHIAFVHNKVPRPKRERRRPRVRRPAPPPRSEDSDS